MNWLLLFALTATVIVLPLVPAIEEWRRPKDVVPLHIDHRDALEPTYLARSFVDALVAVLAAHDHSLGGRSVAEISRIGDWPLDADERRTRRSERIWHARGAATLPAQTEFVGEICATGDLTAPMRSECAALWSGGSLAIGRESRVARWAHGARVRIAADCVLDGRVSADVVVDLEGTSRFGMLHAPIVRFLPLVDVARITAVPREDFASLPIRWDATGRGVCDGPLAIGRGHAWQGDLVGRSHVAIGEGCSVGGGVKAHGTIVIERGCTVSGALVASERIVLGAGCRVTGSVVSESAIVLGRGSRIGTPGSPATVAAPSIEVEAGVIVHGTVWAGEAGTASSDVGSSDVVETPVECIDEPQRLAA